MPDATTHDPHPPRGAAPVNNEFEVGYDQAFERRWRRTELIGHAVMLLFVLAALAGLLGSGPLSHRSATSPDGRLRVDYEPLARRDTGTQITLHLSGSGEPAATAAGPPRRVQVFVSSELIEPLGLQLVLPQPLEAMPTSGGVQYTFTLPPGRASAMVRFQLRPTAIGQVQLDAHEGPAAVHWAQTILP